MKRAEVKELLEESLFRYNDRSFIQHDPVIIPHSFKKKEDIEIAGFLAATIAWGNRKSIITNARRCMRLMDDSPYEFVIGHSKSDLKRFKGFVHRTFNAEDAAFFMSSLQNIYKKHGGLENAFATNDKAGLEQNITQFRKIFLTTKHNYRSEKHLSDPSSGSASKRICMYLRWMVRKDKKGVDFGIWNKISPSQLCLPLDVHTGNVSRKLSLLQRKQNDWKAVMEVSEVLRTFDADDPIKYDLALFGLGVDGVIGK